MSKVIYKTVDADELIKLGQDYIRFYSTFKRATEDEVSKAARTRGKTDRLIIGNASHGDDDRYGDEVVQDGLFEASRAYIQKNPVIMVHHGFDWMFYGYDPVGRALSAEVVKKAVELEAMIGTGKTPDSSIERIWNLIEQDLIRAFSIGFRILKREDKIENDRVIGWRIIELDWMETSIVTIPAVPKALFDMKSAIMAMRTGMKFETFGPSYGERPLSNNHNMASESRAIDDRLRRIREASDGLTEALAGLEGKR